MKQLYALLLAGMLLILTSCGGTEELEEKQGEQLETLKVYTTIYPLQFFSEQIGGHLVDVTNLVPVGADAHTYEPTAKSMIDVANGDLFIYNGAGMEGFAEAIINATENENVYVTKAVEGLQLIDYHHEHHHDEHNDVHEDVGPEENYDHAHGDVDPHVWLDPILSIEIAKKIKNVLNELAPENAAVFEENFTALKEELVAIDEEFRQMVETVEKDRFIVSHAGYGYWEHRYGIKQLGVTGLSPTNEPSQRQLEEIIEYAEQYDLHYVALEQTIPSKVAEVVKNEIGAEVVYLHNMETLRQVDVDEGEDYFSLMRKNIEALQTALK